MEKITLEQLRKLREDKKLELRKKEVEGKVILVCGGTACESSNSVKIYENLVAALKEFGFDDKVTVKKTLHC